MKSKAAWLAAALAAAVWAQDSAGLAREGRYWVETAAGSASLGRTARLKVAARGEVSLRGEDREDIAYLLKKRVRADTEAAARRLLRQFLIETVQQANATALALRMPPTAADAELRLRVPRALREVLLISENGGLEAENLTGALRAETGGGHIRMDEIQGALTVRTGGGNIQLGKIGGAVNCVTAGGSITADWLGAAAELVTGGGEIRVRQAAGLLRLVTGGGNIRVERARSVTATTEGGLIDVLEAEGAVSARTSAGAVRVRAARGLRASSGSGGIQLEAVSGGLRASTDWGNIIAALAAAHPLEDSQLSTSSGDITIFIPSNLAVTVEALNTGGGPPRIISEFPEIRLRRQAGGAEVRGVLNGGGPLLRLAAAGGTIHLRRSQESADTSHDRRR